MVLVFPPPRRPKTRCLCMPMYSSCVSTSPIHRLDLGFFALRMIMIAILRACRRTKPPLGALSRPLLVPVHPLGTLGCQPDHVAASLPTSPLLSAMLAPAVTTVVPLRAPAQPCPDQAPLAVDLLPLRGDWRDLPAESWELIHGRFKSKDVALPVEIHSPAATRCP